MALGKSTHVQWVSDYLSANGVTVCRTREPAQPLWQKIGVNCLLTESMHFKRPENVVMFAARTTPGVP